MERATTPVLSPTGHLLFAREGAVLTAAFDAATAQVQGGGVPVIPQGVLGSSASGSLGLRLAANGTLLYLPQDFHSKRVVSVARDGSALVLDLPRARYTNARVSPDGRRVMIRRQPPRGPEPGARHARSADHRSSRHQLRHLERGRQPRRLSALQLASGWPPTAAAARAR